jgi:hypothetical protein
MYTHIEIPTWYSVVLVSAPYYRVQLVEVSVCTSQEAQERPSHGVAATQQAVALYSARWQNVLNS